MMWTERAGMVCWNIESIMKVLQHPAYPLFRDEE